MSSIIQFRALINLAMSDMHFAEEEREMIYMLADANNVPKESIDNLIVNPEPVGDVSSLDDDDRFQLLYNIVQLMKIDRKVYVTEIKYCQDLAIRLGYNKRVIQELSSKVYANPAITADRLALRAIVERHKER